MSNPGQAILTIGGAIVGGFFGYPQLGFMLGSLAGQAFFPTQLPTIRGPKLDDLGVQGSGIGIPVPLAYGAYRIAGNIIWSTDLIETVTSERVGGKGGPSQRVETTTYSVNFAVGLCEGPITGIRRIWAGGRLIYDRRAQMVDEDTTTYNNRLAAADAIDALSTLYLGTEDQLADPLIESYEGAGNVPAYRGLAYMVFENFQLADYGNNLMATALTFEIIRGGSVEFDEFTEYSPGYIVPFNSDPLDPFTPDNDYRITATIRRTWPFGDGFGVPANEWASSGQEGSLSAALNGLINSTQTDALGHDIRPQWADYFPFATFCSRNNQTNSSTRHSSLFEVQDVDTAYRVTTLYSPFSSEDIYAVYKWEDISGATLENKLKYLRETVGVPIDAVVYIETLFDEDFSSLHEGVVVNTSGFFAKRGPTGLEGGSPLNFLPTAFWDWHAAAGGASNAAVVNDDTSGFYAQWVTAGPIAISGIRIPRVPSQKCAPRVPPNADPPDAPFLGFCDLNGVYYQEGVDWVAQFDEENTRILQNYNTRADYRTQVGPMLHSSESNYNNQTYWEARYAEAVAADLMPSGLDYGTDYPVALNDSFTSPIAYYILVTQRSFISTEVIRLREIVGDLCDRSGLIADEEYDVSELTQQVYGYAVGRISDAASAIQPLRLYGFFDMVESGGVLKFVVRGGVEVATIPADDLAAHESGTDRPTAVKVSRMQDIELPRVIRVKYAMLDKDYEPGEQYASRLLTTADQVVDMEIPVAMPDVLAAQIADITLYEAWQGRNSYEFMLSQKHALIEPTDPILLTVDGATQRVRIVNDEFAIPGIKTMKAVRDGGAEAYSSYVGGGSPAVPGQTIRPRDNTVAFYLDLPMLLESNNDAGYYVAMRQENDDNFWPGGSALRSADGGATYTLVATATRQSVTGFVTEIRTLGVVQSFLPPGNPETIEYNIELDVTLDLDNMQLSSTTLEGILSGANAAAVGADGRWEIIQFMSAELISTTGPGSVWTLSGLVRGRRGTEYIMNQILGVPGDRFIMLGNVVRATQESASIGASRHLKAVTSGQSINDVASVLFTGNGTALKPFAPVWLQGARDGSDNLTISWTRRSRFGQELPSGSDIPLGEEIEQYDVEIFDGSTIVRSVTVTEPSYLYTAADQTTDFGSPQSSVVVAIYQRSAIVGRGYPLEGQA